MQAFEKVRERRIAVRALVASSLLAVLLKADLFAMLSHPGAPWETFCWVRPPGEGWMVGRFIKTLGGTVLTGVALSFGSKFWHDLLDRTYGARGAVHDAGGKE